MDLMKTFEEITFGDTEIKRENANIDGETAMGVMLKYGSEASKEFYLERVLKPEHAKAHREGDIHIHDLDFYALTTTCTQIELRKLFKDGFCTGHGFLREPQDIQSYAALACIAIQSNQNDQHGGQSIMDFDYAMADGVRKTYAKRYKHNYVRAKELLGNSKKEDEIQKWAEKAALEDTERATYQAMEAFIHNLNTMHSRAGAQVPFSSINYGMDTSPEGRMVIKNLLLATEAGLGNSETPIFPIQIFRVKDGVNAAEGDPSYDLFKLACHCSAKRLFPNFSFQDAPFNKMYYDPSRPETEIAYMGCRTRVVGNAYDRTREQCSQRGNLSFTSINLPRIAIEAKGNMDEFWRKLDETIDLCADQLMHRFAIQSKKKVYNMPFLMGQGVWLDSEKLKPNDEVGEVLKHGTLSVGFIGLAEALVALIGFHHGQSRFAQNLGLKIVSHMRSRMDEKSELSGLNFTLLATPAEGLSGRFVRMDKERYGIIEGVTDREYYTNSFHVPVHYDTDIFSKIDIEAPYHALTNAGHITYVELDADLTKNVEAFEAVITYMKNSGIGYGSINHPVDRDPECGYTGIINEVCPKCGRKECEGAEFERIRRVTGYLVGDLKRWNKAKRAEESERVKHGLR